MAPPSRARSFVRASGRAAANVRLGKVDAQSPSLNLEQRLGIRKAGQAMSTETPETNAGRRRSPDRHPGRGGHDDLPTVGRRAHARGGVNGQTDVAHIGQCRLTAMDPDAHPHLETVDPRSAAELALDRHRRFDGGTRPLEDREELVGARVDLSTAHSKHGVPEDGPDVVQEGSVAITEPAQQDGRALDIGHQQGHEPGGE